MRDCLLTPNSQLLWRGTMVTAAASARPLEDVVRDSLQARDLETLTDIYVVEPDDILIGVFSLRQLILAAPETPVRELMQTRIISVAPTEDREVAARLIERYNFLALPVVQDRRILGIITVD